MADAPEQVAQTITHRTTTEERVAASRVVLAHARSHEDLHELMQMLGLNQPAGTAARKRTAEPTATTTDVPINTREAK